MAKTIAITVSHRALLYAAIAVIVVTLVVLNAYAFLRPSSSGNAVEKTAENFNAFKAAENPTDKCAVPPGYTEKEWKEHMGHHPDQYAECL